MRKHNRRQFFIRSSPSQMAPLAPGATAAQSLSLQSADGLTLRRVKAEPVTYKGCKGIRIASDGSQNGFAIVAGPEFQDGTVEVDLAGEPGPGAQSQARGFVGVAFRMAPDASKFELIYVRPTSGRADDQERRNHSTHYDSENQCQRSQGEVVRAWSGTAGRSRVSQCYSLIGPSSVGLMLA